jgi:hypothetical protein
VPYSNVRWTLEGHFLCFTFATVDNTEMPKILYNTYAVLLYPQMYTALNRAFSPKCFARNTSDTFLSFVFTFTTSWINGRMTWPHSCYISMSLDLLSPCCTKQAASLHWRIIDTWFTRPRWSWEERTCLMRAVMLFVGFGDGFTCRISDARPAILLKGLRRASCLFIFHITQHASQHSSGLMNKR